MSESRPLGWRRVRLVRVLGPLPCHDCGTLVRIMRTPDGLVPYAGSWPHRCTLSPVDTPLLDRIEKSPAQGVVHDWPR